MIHGCNKCLTITAWIFIVLGILFLLRDLNIWNFWNIQWWTILFIIIGVTTCAHKSCEKCSEMCNMEPAKKKK
jgi:hypothetical protein